MLKRNAAFILCCILGSLYAQAQAPAANFTADSTSGCFPIVVKFKDLSTGNPTAWDWDLGNGSTSTLQNPAATYLEPGFYTVTLKATNANGTTTVVKESFISVYQKPQTAFQVSSQTGCTPASIQFTDATVSYEGNTIKSWKWDFGDGGVASTEQNPTYVYERPGSYTVTLTVTNDKGCSALQTKPNYIDIVKGVTPRFSNTQQTVCTPPVSIAFTNTSTGPETLSYLWDFGNGKTSTEKNPVNLYENVGSYAVKLIVQSSLGCMDSIRVNNAVPITEIITKFNVQDACPNTEIQFADSSTAFTNANLWRFSDGRTDNQPTVYKVFKTPGTYTATLINYYNTCTDSLTKTFTVSPTPAVEFSASTSASCQVPFPVTFTATATDAATYQWDFGDGTGSTEANPVHSYTDYGNYNVTLTITTVTGCSATMTKPSFVKVQKPVVRIKNGAKRGCIPYSITFVDAVTSFDPITAYRWDFGDGNFSTEKNPAYTYTIKGSYDVSLTVTTSNGCTETYTLKDAVKVGTKPTAAFNSDKTNVCASEAVQFTDASTDADEWSWDFGDGTSATERNPNHEFSNFGDLKVQLIAKNSGCPDTVTKEITIRAPIAKFTYRPNCDNRRQLSFKNESATGTIPASDLTWAWNFGDGSPVVNSKDPGPHLFPSFGSYAVSLTVSGGGCTFTVKNNVSTQARKPDFAVDVPSGGGCKPLNAVFSPSEAANAGYTTYVWNYGDGTTETTSGAGRHTYTKAGLYDVSVVATDVYGCQDAGTPKVGVVRVNGPVADFSSTNNTGCKGISVTFDDKSTTDGQNAIVNWQWDFGDRTSQTYTAPPFQHTYNEVARYGVKLVVTDAAGCKDSITKTNFVKTSDFKMDWNGTRQTCPGALTRDSSVANIRDYTSFWDFGNGATSMEKTPRYAYPDTGTYTIKLVITDALGCKDSLTKPNYVRVYRPKADFEANNLATYCIPFEAHFTNNSTYYQSSRWELGIGTSTQTNPVSYYTKTGTYKIKLTVTSPGGCRDDTTQVLRVFDARDGKLTYGPLDFSCRPLNVNFKAFSDMKGTFIWDFGDGTVVENTVNTLSHTYDKVGDIYPKIILIEPSGCKVPITGAAPIQVAGANIKFGIDKGLFCDSGRVTIFDSTVVHGRNISYSWEFGDGTVSNDPNPGSHFYSTPGLYRLKLTVKTGNVGCVDSLTIVPAIKVSLTPVIRISGDSVICVNDYLQSGGVFDKRDSSFIRWAWQFPNGTTSGVQLPPDQQFTTAGQFVINTIATNGEGCADTALKNVLVHPLPTATLPSTFTVQPGFPATITGEYSSGVRSYIWRPTTGLSCTDCPSPVASPKFNTKYIVQYTDSNGCRNSNAVQVIVLCKNANVFVPNTFSPNGDGSNDVFYVRGKGLDRVKSLRIFNRWGEVVFEKRDFPVNDPAVGWDGRYKSSAPKADVYVYQVEVFCENSEVIRFSGNVALIQ